MGLSEAKSIIEVRTIPTRFSTRCRPWHIAKTKVSPGATQKEAALRYRKAAAQGQTNAQFLLGRICEEGQGVPKSAARGLLWYPKAATQGKKKL